MATAGYAIFTVCLCLSLSISEPRILLDKIFSSPLSLIPVCSFFEDKLMSGSWHKNNSDADWYAAGDDSSDEEVITAYGKMHTHGKDIFSLRKAPAICYT